MFRAIMLVATLVGGSPAIETAPFDEADLFVRDALAGREVEPAAPAVVFQVPPVSRPRSSRSGLLGGLYAATAAMQALDVHSTLRALDAGASEANPLMAGLTRHRGAFIAAKAAVTTTSILAARSLARRSKVAAVVTLVAVNSAYAAIVRHNYRVAGR